MDKLHQMMPDIEILPAHFPIPGMGFLAVNAFVIKAREPVLVDTGMGIESKEFMNLDGKGKENRRYRAGLIRIRTRRR